MRRHRITLLALAVIVVGALIVAARIMAWAHPPVVQIPAGYRPTALPVSWPASPVPSPRGTVTTWVTVTATP
jgi:hypothetical protein